MKGDFPSDLNADTKESRHWSAMVTGIWAGWPVALRTTILMATAAWGSSYATKQLQGTTAQNVLMDEDDWRKVVRSEMAPLKAGFKAFVATQPEKTQLAVLRAWTKEEEKQKEMP